MKKKTFRLTIDVTMSEMSDEDWAEMQKDGMFDSVGEKPSPSEYTPGEIAELFDIDASATGILDELLAGSGVFLAFDRIDVVKAEEKPEATTA